MTFKKGQSGNPATQFSSTNQPKNRGKKGKSISEFLREFGEAKSVEYEIKITKGGETKTKKGKIESETTLNEVVATTLLTKAMTGDLRAVDIVLNRVEGKPTQKVEVDVPDIPEMSLEEKMKRISELTKKAKEI